METIGQKLLQLLAVMGIGVLVVLAGAFWLFYKVKQAAEEQDATRAPERRPSDAHSHGTD